MYTQFTDRARKVMQLANQEAQRLNHEYIGTEHVLLGLIKEGSGVAANVLKNLDVDLRKIRLEAEKLVQSGPDMVTIGKLPQTPRAKKVIEYALEEARGMNHNYVGTEHILLGLLRVQEGVAAQVLMNLGLKLEEVREEVRMIVGTGVEQPNRGSTNIKASPGWAENDGEDDTSPEALQEMVREILATRYSGRNLARRLFTELPWSLAISAFVGFASGSWIVFGLALVLLVMRDVVQAIWPRP